MVPPHNTPNQRSKAEGRDVSPGQPWGELESLVAEGAEGCVGVPAVVCSQCYLLQEHFLRGQTLEWK